MLYWSFYTHAFAENLRKVEGRERRRGMASRASLLYPTMLVWLSPPLRTRLGWPNSPTLLVVMGALFSMCLSVRLILQQLDFI